MLYVYVRAAVRSCTTVVLYYQEIGQLKEAEADYATLLASDPKDPDAHHNLGYIALRYKEDYPAAIRHFTDAIRYNPEYAEAYYHRGLAESAWATEPQH